MIHPNMATMLGFVATDAPLAAALLATLAREVADASFNRVTIDGDTSTNDSFVLIATGAGARCAPIDARRRPAPRRAARRADRGGAVELAQAIVRDGEGATKFITIARRRRARRRRMPTRRARASRIRRWSRPRSSPPIRISAASSARSATPASPTSIRRACRSGSTTCWSSSDGGRAASLSRGGRPARDEAGRDHRARRARPRQRDGDRVDLRFLARLRQRSTPTTGADDAVTERDLDAPARARRERCSTASRRCCPPRRPAPDWKARGVSLAQARPAAATCRRSRIRTRSALDDLVADRRAEARDRRRTRASSSPACRPTTCC